MGISVLCLPRPQCHSQWTRRWEERQRWPSTRIPSTWLHSPSPLPPDATEAWIMLETRRFLPAQQGTRRGRSSSSRWWGRARRRTSWCKWPENQALPWVVLSYFHPWHLGLDPIDHRVDCEQGDQRHPNPRHLFWLTLIWTFEDKTHLWSWRQVEGTIGNGCQQDWGYVPGVHM